MDRLINGYMNGPNEWTHIVREGTVMISKQ